MSVRDCLLAIMSLGPQYGLQLHAELTSRAPHRAATNVGQIYSTLDRLVRDAKVVTGGQTSDGLPLYRLTESGTTEISAWLEPEGVSRDTAWADLLDLVFMVRSLPHINPLPAFDAIAFSFGELPEPPAGDSAKGRTAWLLALAEEDLARTVRSIVERARTEATSTSERGWGLSTERPKRGRRPLNPAN
jgi:DNA-binding PadR family transcriptional regulator